MEKNNEGLVFKEQEYVEDSLKDLTFIDCDFENCRFENLKLVNCRFVSCKFDECDLISLKSLHSEFKNCTLEKCNLININFSELSPSGKHAHAIEKMQNSFLKYNSFFEMNLVKFDFSSNTILETNFDECSLEQANFNGVNLEATQFMRCDLKKADFRNSRGYLIDLDTNNVKQAKFSFPEVVNLLASLDIIID